MTAPEVAARHHEDRMNLAHATRREAENVDETARRDEGGGTNTLTRAITGPLLFVFILGDVLGAGIYALVGVIAGEVGGAVWVPLLVALVMALLTATSYAELVTKYPRAGGAAVFAQRAYRKPLISFLVGFSMLAAGVTSAAGLALAFSGDYLKASSTSQPFQRRSSSCSWWDFSMPEASRSRCAPTSS